MAELIEVRATANLPGLRDGDVVLVDPDNEYVQAAIANDYLVPLVDDEPQTESP